MASEEKKESKIKILGQFIIYSIFAIVTTIINLGGQVFMTNILLIDSTISAIIALAIGYTVKFFLDCFITFREQRMEEMDIRKHYLVYMMTALVFYVLNLVIQIFVTTPFVRSLFLNSFEQFLVVNKLMAEPLLVTLLYAGAAVAVVFIIKFPFDKYIVFKLLPEKMTKS